MNQADTGLVKRGLILLAMMAALVIVVVVIIVRGTGTPAPAPPIQPEQILPLIAQPTAPFPGNISWGGVWQLVETLPSDTGWEIRYNAASTLARRGSNLVTWDVLLEMLDEHRQLNNCRDRLDNGHNVVDVAAAQSIIVDTLDAIGIWHQKNQEAKAPPTEEMQQVYAAVDHLAETGSLEVRSQANKIRKDFFR